MRQVRGAQLGGANIHGRTQDNAQQRQVPVAVTHGCREGVEQAPVPIGSRARGKTRSLSMNSNLGSAHLHRCPQSRRTELPTTNPLLRVRTCCLRIVHSSERGVPRRACVSVTESMPACLRTSRAGRLAFAKHHQSSLRTTKCSRRARGCALTPRCGSRVSVNDIARPHYP